MFVINEDKSIYITRGDVAFFTLSTETESGEAYKFQAGDVVRFKVFEKKACENVVLSKDFGIEAETEEVEIYLEENDTKIGEVISKPTDYWYEVELNPYTDPQTIIGYDDDGPKVFKLFPEGNESEDSDPITPEDIPVVDEELSLTSTRPVQNQAIARAITSIRENFNTVLTKVVEDVSTDLAEIKAIKENVEGDFARLSAEAERLTGETEKLSEDSEKLSEDLANAKAALESLTVEDISADFIESKANKYTVATAKVYKQGNVISGLLAVMGLHDSVVADDVLLSIKEQYKPIIATYVPTLNVEALKDIDDTYAEDITMPNRNLAVAIRGGDLTVEYIDRTAEEITGFAMNFTYICN
jgi:hypothetical protein